MLQLQRTDLAGVARPARSNGLSHLPYALHKHSSSRRSMSADLGQSAPLPVQHTTQLLNMTHHGTDPCFCFLKRDWAGSEPAITAQSAVAAMRQSLDSAVGHAIEGQSGVVQGLRVDG
jgi:hypothetical protein